MKRYTSEASFSHKFRVVYSDIKARETYSTRVRINTTRYAGLQSSGLATLQDSKIQDYYLSWQELPAQITVCEALELYPIPGLNKLNPNICRGAVKTATLFILLSFRVLALLNPLPPRDGWSSQTEGWGRTITGKDLLRCGPGIRTDTSNPDGITIVLITTVCLSLWQERIAGVEKTESDWSQ